MNIGRSCRPNRPRYVLVVGVLQHAARDGRPPPAWRRVLHEGAVRAVLMAGRPMRSICAPGSGGSGNDGGAPPCRLRARRAAAVGRVASDGGLHPRAATSGPAAVLVVSSPHAARNCGANERDAGAELSCHGSALSVRGVGGSVDAADLVGRVCEERRIGFDHDRQRIQGSEEVLGLGLRDERGARFAPVTSSMMGQPLPLKERPLYIC